MFIVRPVAHADIPALVGLATGATSGVHTMAKTPDAIARIVQLSERSFASNEQAHELAGDEAYLFVLEDASNQNLIGSALISATAGSNGTFFCFRNDVLQQASRDLNISHSVHALTLCADLTSYSQLSSFFVQQNHVKQSQAALLSRARLMFAACFPERFHDHFFVSLAGYTDHQGQSPFWEALGRHFFKMDFLSAEHVVEGARNRSLIIELMPHYPVYVPLLSGEAQAAMGQVHPESEVPFDILTAEGFAADEFIDIFDGGPILEAHKNKLRSFAQATTLIVTHQVDNAAIAALDLSIKNDPQNATQWLIATPRVGQFRATLIWSVAQAIESHTQIYLPQPICDALQVKSGDKLLCVAL